MPKLPPMTAREVEAILERAGFVFVRQTGHRYWRKGEWTVDVPAHRGDIPRGTLHNNVKQTGMTSDEFLSFR
jgi:predicted RNA binding protein YcfA (HicA-like mRNA interferase family)